jgi:tetratricopeptide (TPR) repeat protein
MIAATRSRGGIAALVAPAALLAACSAPCLPLLSDEVLTAAGESRFAAAEAALASGDAAAAERRYREVLASFPDHFRSLRGLQDALLALGRDDEARALGEQRLAAGEDAAGHLLLARVATPDEAEREIAAARASDPANRFAQHAAAVVAIRQGALDEAEELLGDALQSCEPYPEARLARARVRAILGRFDAAVGDYRLYLELERGDTAAMHELASLLHREVRDEDAAELVYHRMLDLDPTSTAAIVGIAVLLTERGRFAEAETLYRTIVDREPTAWFNLGLLYREKLDRPQDALRCFEAFVAYAGPGEGERGFGDLWLLAPAYIEELRRAIDAGGAS